MKKYVVSYSICRYKTNLSGDGNDKSDKVNLILIPDVEAEENLQYSDENLFWEKTTILHSVVSSLSKS